MKMAWIALAVALGACNDGLVVVVPDGMEVPTDMTVPDLVSPKCDDGVKNGAETDTDCGGPLCAPCVPPSACKLDSDCTSAVCRNGHCALPTCSDGAENADESDIDCGGSCTRKCDDSKACLIDADCVSIVCKGKQCQAATCMDAVMNQDETDVNCGGTKCPACGEGKKCSLASDCMTRVCMAMTCRPSTCIDGVKNGDETDVDCGGSCPTCGDGKSCVAMHDCSSGVCTSMVCQKATCSDTVKNGGETDLNCGGPCSGCASGKMCKSTSDCASMLVCLSSVCSTASCSDGLKDQSETDVDCGGGGCPKCTSGKACLSNGDCDSMVCSAHVCAAATCSDGALNQNESDIDCGGSCSPCGNQKQCNMVATNCISGACTSGQCAPWSRHPFGDSRIHRIATAPNGDVLAVGEYNGPLDLGTVQLPASTVSYDIFVARYDATGTILWAKAYPGSGNPGEGDFGASLAFLPGGDAVVVGHGGSVDFRTPTGNIVGTAGGRDVVIARIDATGKTVWATGFGTAAGEQASDVDVDPAGNIYVVGSAFGGGQLSFGSVGSVPTNSAWAAKLDGNGVPQWAVGYSGGNNGMSAVAYDGANGGSLILGGYYYSGTLVVGSFPMPSAGPNAAMLLARNRATDGSLVWAKGYYSSVSDTTPYRAAADGNGSVYIAGTAANGVNLGAGTVMTSGPEDAMLLKMTVADGTLQWMQLDGGSGADDYQDVRVSSRGVSVIAEGQVAGTVHAGGQTLSPTMGTYYALVSRYDGSGKPAGAVMYQSTNSIYGLTLSLSSAGGTYIGGKFIGTTNLGAGAITSSANNVTDAFLASIGNQP